MFGLRAESPPKSVLTIDMVLPRDSIGETKGGRPYSNTGQGNWRSEAIWRMLVNGGSDSHSGSRSWKAGKTTDLGGDPHCLESIKNTTAPRDKTFSVRHMLGLAKEAHQITRGSISQPKILMDMDPSITYAKPEKVSSEGLELKKNHNKAKWKRTASGIKGKQIDNTDLGEILQLGKRGTADCEEKIQSIVKKARNHDLVRSGNSDFFGSGDERHSGEEIASEAGSGDVQQSVVQPRYSRVSIGTWSKLTGSTLGHFLNDSQRIWVTGDLNSPGATNETALLLFWKGWIKGYAIGAGPIGFLSTLSITLSFEGSDHQPLLLEFLENSAPNLIGSASRRRFYFEDCLAKDEEYQNIVSTVWGTSGCNENLHKVLGKIANCGRKLDSLNARKREQHRQEVSKYRKELKEASKIEIPQNWGHIRRLEDKLDDALAIEENYWGKGQKANWMKMGDRNSHFFHAKAMGRRSRNRITGLFDRNSTWKDSKENLERIITGYFSELFTSCNPSNMDIEMVTNNLHARLLVQLVRYLETKFTIADVGKAVIDISPLKAPGPNGLSAGFY
ncbi:hypothetical protein Dsin_005071 [Dipteronia sinensis]|uniref:Uncharacterized protein n=1 Tax=Dipteronia sinensis TaxID=43782 RepID=A0AAE0AX52_9ROSI|nr:hypothetical protein Dsin_005071 [Dipteronia sinensis]